MEFVDIYYYDETSPSCLRWKITRCRARKDAVAGGLTSEGYYRVRNISKKHLVHRVIWEMFHGKIPEGLVVDHINRDRSDNRICNLRLLSYEDSAHNCQKKSSNNSNKTGVCYEEGKSPRWRATWMSACMKLSTKSFSVKKYGFDIARTMAADYRDKMIEHLMENGVFYSEDHGV